VEADGKCGNLGCFLETELNSPLLRECNFAIIYENIHILVIKIFHFNCRNFWRCSVVHCHLCLYALGYTVNETNDVYLNVMYLAGNLSLQYSFVINTVFYIDGPKSQGFQTGYLKFPTSVHHSLRLSIHGLTSCMCCVICRLAVTEL
jgi:hypothetical protein